MTAEAKRLAEVVKATHKRLRRRYRQECDERSVWDDHVMRSEELREYSQAMKTLATDHWMPHSQSQSRVHWVHSAITQYYYEGGMQRAVDKEMRKLFHLSLSPDYTVDEERQNLPGRLKVLDVGSCYNPFSVYKELDVTAIDLCPASQSVMKGDFLKIHVTEPNEMRENPLTFKTAENTHTDLVLAEGRTDINQVPAETGKDQLPAKIETDAEIKRDKDQVPGQIHLDHEIRKGTGQDSENLEGNRMSEEEDFKQSDETKSSESKKSPEQADFTQSKETKSSESKHSLESKEVKEQGELCYATSGEATHSFKSKEATVQGESTEQVKSALGTKITESPKFKVESITFLPRLYFDVVIFCLFLEYIPSPSQRMACCQKAYQLLRPNGILCIVTPDSKHQNANVVLYKLWKISLEFLGFTRVKYEKLTHFHGMVLRKGLCRAAWDIDAERELSDARKITVRGKFAGIDYDKVHSEMYIPQDFHDPSDSENDLDS